ncbi:MAG: hypothetical protein IKV61_00340 [Clostridia bacterium]|nr:hypothetical protein [Clostridia bacterium]
MKVTILKSNQFIAFFEGFTGVPVIANSLNELKKQVVNEVYRVCNFLEQKLPKDANSVEVLKTISVKESVKDLDENLFYIGFNKRAYSEFKSLFIQTAFSFKCMVDSLKNAEEYLEGACNLICDTAKCGCGGIIETAFNATSNLDKLYSENDLLAYKRTIKLCYVLTNYALTVYNKEKLNNNIQDIFYFD